MAGGTGTKSLPTTMVEATPEQTEKAPRASRRLRRLLLEVIAVAGVYLAVSAWQERRLIRTNKPAPNFTLEALDGRSVSLESLRGKRVLVHFWATWCGVCRREFGALNAVNRRLGPDEALLTVVADSDDRERIRGFVTEHDIDYPVLLGTDAVLRAFHVDMFPTNYYVDGSGMIVSHTIGMSTRFALASRLGCAKR
jgi:peroxiredoxin